MEAALPPDAPMTGAALRDARRDARLSRRALAALCGLHPDTVRYWEAKPYLDMRGHAPERMLKALGLGHLSRRGVYPSERFHASRFGDYATTTRARLGVLAERGISGRHKKCGARTRKGVPCRAVVLPGKTRCKFHGGASTGPRTVEGRARIAEAQRNRWAAWRDLKGR
jgi:hypothetical protein